MSVLKKGQTALFALILLTAPGVLFAAVERVETFSIDNASGGTLELLNLAGQVTIEPANGNAIEIEAKIVADDSAGMSADEVAALISFDQDSRGSRKYLSVVYPVDDYRNYRYQPESWSGSSNTSTKYMRKKVRVSSRNRSKALDVHVDLTIKVPAGGGLKMINKVGRIDAANVESNLNLDTGSGSVSVTGSKGSLRADTGSGRVTISGQVGRIVADTGSGSVTISDSEGDVSADTGSGSVTISNVTGNVKADTGSGSVDLTDVMASEISADTGSGTVSLENVTGSLHVDTGSGGLHARNFFAGETVNVDTGSGSIRVEGNLGQVRKLRLDAGSGGVRVRTAQLPDMTLRVETGSGGINIDLPGMTDVRRGDDWFEARIGNGSGDGEIDTGSGSVTFTLD